MDQSVEIYKAASHIIEEGFRAAGIEEGEEFIALKKLLTAEKMIVDKYGVEHYESDNAAIGRGVELTLRLRRLLDNRAAEIKDVSVTHKIAPEDIDRLEKIAAELKGLEGRLLLDKTQQGEIIEVASVRTIK